MEISCEIQQLRQAKQDDKQMLGELWNRYRGRLCRMVQTRLDRRVKGRIDVSDVMQEAFVDVSKRLPQYLEKPSMPFSRWLRFLVGQKLLQLHRHHLGVKARNAAREVSLQQKATRQAISGSIDMQLSGQLSAPSQRVAKTELKQRLQAALDQLQPIDREILTLRHFEQLSMAEAAEAMNIKLTAACNRYVRALDRLKAVIPEEFRQIWQ